MHRDPNVSPKALMVEYTTVCIEAKHTIDEGSVVVDAFSLSDDMQNACLLLGRGGFQVLSITPLTSSCTGASHALSYTSAIIITASR